MLCITPYNTPLRGGCMQSHAISLLEEVSLVTPLKREFCTTLQLLFDRVFMHFPCNPFQRGLTVITEFLKPLITSQVVGNGMEKSNFCPHMAAQSNFQVICLTLNNTYNGRGDLYLLFLTSMHIYILHCL